MATPWRVLFVGNSFSVDSTEYMPNILTSLGYQEFAVGNLYIGGCSIAMHHKNLTGEEPAYEYFYHNGGVDWRHTYEQRIDTAVKCEPWDVIVIQHGSADGSRYTDIGSYCLLEDLIARLRASATNPAVRILLNMTWVGEPTNQHPEIVAYGGDTARQYRDLIDVTHKIANTKGLDGIVPTGVAVENARAVIRERDLTLDLQRDGYHLGWHFGRFVAALNVIHTLTNADITKVTWHPDYVDEAAAQLAVQAVKAATRW